MASSPQTPPPADGDIWSLARASAPAREWLLASAYSAYDVPVHAATSLPETVTLTSHPGSIATTALYLPHAGLPHRLELGHVVLTTCTLVDPSHAHTPACLLIGRYAYRAPNSSVAEDLLAVFPPPTPTSPLRVLRRLSLNPSAHLRDALLATPPPPQPPSPRPAALPAAIPDPSHTTARATSVLYRRDPAASAAAAAAAAAPATVAELPGVYDAAPLETGPAVRPLPAADAVWATAAGGGHVAVAPAAPATARALRDLLVAELARGVGVVRPAAADPGPALAALLPPPRASAGGGNVADFDALFGALSSGSVGGGVPSPVSSTALSPALAGVHLGAMPPAPAPVDEGDVVADMLAIKPEPVLAVTPLPATGSAAARQPFPLLQLHVPPLQSQGPAAPLLPVADPVVGSGGVYRGAAAVGAASAAARLALPVAGVIAKGGIGGVKGSSARTGRRGSPPSPSEVVMRNRISAQKSNEKRRHRIEGWRVELARLKTEVLPRLMDAHRSLRGENERVRAALERQFGKQHLVSLETLF